MSNPNEIRKLKKESLSIGFKEIGLNPNSLIGQVELLQMLNRRARSGHYDSILSDKLFQVLSLDYNSSLAINDFINGYLQFEDDMRKNTDLFNRRLAEEKEILANLEEQCRRYKNEKINKEGFCKDAKISGEITDVDIHRHLEGIKEIIIIVVYNEKEKEFRFKIGGSNRNALLNAKFEFHPTSRKDHFEFIMKGVNDRNQTFDIGRKIFPLVDITTQEEYSVQIIIPEIDDEDTIAAYINGKILLFWSDYELYESQRRKSEKLVGKLTEAAAKAADYLRKIREIYGDLNKRTPDLYVNFNNERLLEKKLKKVNVVVFNNQKKIATEDKMQQTDEQQQKEIVVEPQVLHKVKEQVVVKPTIVIGKTNPTIYMNQQVIPEKSSVLVNKESITYTENIGANTTAQNGIPLITSGDNGFSGQAGQPVDNANTNENLSNTLGNTGLGSGNEVIAGPTLGTDVNDILKNLISSAARSPLLDFQQALGGTTGYNGQGIEAGASQVLGTTEFGGQVIRDEYLNLAMIPNYIV